MILDTNAISDFFKERKALRAHVEKADQLYLPSIVLGEYLYGIKSSTRAQELSELFWSFIREIRVVGVGEKTASHYADIRWELKKKGAPIPENDIWIAALTREFALPLLSRDAHFDVVEGIERLSW